MKKVCIDAGHGGFDPGAVGLNGLKEKYINLQIAKKVKDNLKEVGIEVVMTRMTDIFISLSERCAISNQNKCDLFVSIHANACEDRPVKGSEIFNYTGKATPLTNTYESMIKKFTLGENYRGLKNGDCLYVINSTDAPAYLIETDFITTPSIESQLKKDDIQNKYALIIYTAIICELGLNTSYDVANEIKYLCAQMQERPKDFNYFKEKSQQINSHL